MKIKYKILTIIACSYVLFGCSNIDKTSPKADFNSDSIKSIILNNENAALERWYNGDPMGFIDNSWEDVTYFDPSLITRVDSIAEFRALLTPIIGKVHVPAHKLDKPLVQVFGNIAILTFTDVFTLNMDTIRWHATEIYQCRNNEWKLIHSHWTESRAK